MQLEKGKRAVKVNNIDTGFGAFSEDSAKSMSPLSSNANGLPLSSGHGDRKVSKQVDRTNSEQLRRPDNLKRTSSEIAVGNSRGNHKIRGLQLIQ
jgi:hypothetical protein